MLPVDALKWDRNESKSYKDFIKNCNEDIDIGYFLWSWCLMSLQHNCW